MAKRGFRRERANMASPLYQPATYWAQRLGRNFTLDGVGYEGLGVGMNTWIYRRRRDAVRRLLATHDISLRGLTVAELGIGTGYWFREWQRLGAEHLLGFDITAVSVERLKSVYPHAELHECDLGNPGSVQRTARGRTVDFVAAMEVLGHIVDPGQFEAALDNIAGLSHPGTWLLLSDLFLSLEARSHHQLSRTIEEYRDALLARGLVLVARTPVFFALHPFHFGKQGIQRHFAEAWWWTVTKSLRVAPLLGWPLGALLFLIDSALAAVVEEGPSTHLTLWRRA